MGIFQQFPYSNFHEFNLDQIIKIMREMQDEWEATKTEWNDMKDFINNYFDNLDVSEEVYGALVKMAHNGILSGIIDPTIISATSSWLAEHITQPVGVVIDDSLSIQGACADAAATGNAVYGINFLQSLNEIIVPDIDDGYFYNTTTGVKTAGSGWSASKTLIPFKTDVPLVAVSTCGNPVVLVCYDQNKTIINGGNPARAKVPGAVVFATPIPAGTYYVGVNIHVSPVSSMSFKIYEAPDANEAPFSNVDYVDNYLISGSGLFSSSASYATFMINTVAGDKWYTNERVSNNFACYDATGAFISQAPYTDIGFYGRVYTIPADTVFAYATVRKASVHQGVAATVVYKITKDSKILCVGDSVTYLDDRDMSPTDNATRFLGYQKQLQKAGYQVNSKGWSGASYATGFSSSIYTGVVTNALDVTGYDIIILFGGLNDDLNNAPIGTIPADYSGNTYNTANTIDAMCAICEYIRTNNPDAKIILSTMTKSQSANRPYNEAIQYDEAIKNVAEFESCYLIDMFRDMNIQPFTTGFTNNFYDGTHPNKQGMEKIGKIMLNAVDIVAAE